MTVGVIIQARTGSKRFPRKVLADLNGSPVIQHVIDRCQQFGERVVLTVPWYDVGVFTKYTDKIAYGPEDDVLERYYRAAKDYHIDKIVRITADCPLISPKIMDEVYKLFLTGCSYAALSEEWPLGLGVEIFDLGTLEDARRYAQDPYDREHVTPWMQKYVRCKYLANPNGDESYLNYCIDFPEDLDRIRQHLMRTKGDQKENEQ